MFLKYEVIQQANTIAPRETIAYFARSSERWGDIVVKVPVSQTIAQQILWLNKQFCAQKISCDIRKIANTHYNIPETYLVQPFEVLEEVVHGKPITETFFKELSFFDQEQIRLGLAHFLNDMNQSHTILPLQDRFSKSVTKEQLDFANILIVLKKFFPNKTLTEIRQAKKYFDDNSIKNGAIVFAHRDLNPHNVFFNTDTKQLSIIDFAEAGYETLNHMFYRDLKQIGHVGIDKVIDLYKNLPKKYNISFDFNKDIFVIEQKLYNFYWSCANFLRSSSILTDAKLNIIKTNVEDLLKTFQMSKVQNMKPLQFMTMQKTKGYA